MSVRSDWRSSATGAERRALEQLARAHGVEATFHGHVADAVDRLGTLDVFVLPSRAENFPIALLEAMSWALPSVATTVGGIPEMIEAGESGLLVPPDDVDALAVGDPRRDRSPGAGSRDRCGGRHESCRPVRPGGRRPSDGGGVSLAVRILHVIQEMGRGGAERVVLTLAADACRAGHEVAIASAPGSLDAEVDADRFEMPLIRRDIRKLPSAAAALASIVGRWSPDVVHCHNPAMALVAAAATGRGAWRPVVASVHGVPEEDYERSARILRLTGFMSVACGPGCRGGAA